MFTGTHWPNSYNKAQALVKGKLDYPKIIILTHKHHFHIVSPLKKAGFKGGENLLL